MRVTVLKLYLPNSPRTKIRNRIPELYMHTMASTYCYFPKLMSLYSQNTNNGCIGLLISNGVAGNGGIYKNKSQPLTPNTFLPNGDYTNPGIDAGKRFGSLFPRGLCSGLADRQR